MRWLLLLAAAAVLAVTFAGCGASSQAKQTKPVPGTYTTASGLQYQELKLGTGYAPVTDDIVIVDYIAYLEAGNTKFDSSYDPGGKPLEYAIGHSLLLDGSDKVIAGVREAIQGMRVGGQRRLLIPPDLGYDQDGKPPLVPADATLIYYVELKGIKQMDQIQTGLYQMDLQEGAGAGARNGDKLVVNYTGWTYDDVKFDSSFNEGRSPFEFTLGKDEVIQGWDLGLVGMKVGGKRRLLISPDLGYGNREDIDLIPPGTWLIFNVELLEIKP